MDKFLAVPSTSGMAQQPPRSRSRSPSPNCPHRPKDKFITIFQTFKNAFQDGMHLQRVGEKTLKYNNTEINVDCISTSPNESLEYIKKQQRRGTCVILFGRSGAGKTSSLVGYEQFGGMIQEYYRGCPEANLELRAIEIKNKMSRDLVATENPETKVERLDWEKIEAGRIADLNQVMKARTTIKTGLNATASRTILYVEVTNIQTQDRVHFVDMPGSEGVDAADAATLTPAERSLVSSTRRGFVNDLSSFKNYLINYNIPLSGTVFLNELRRRIYGDGTNVSNSNMFLVVCAQSPLNEANTMEVGNLLRDIQLQRDPNFHRGSGRSPSPHVNAREPSRGSLLRTVDDLKAEIERLRLENERLRRRRRSVEAEDRVADEVEAEAEVAAAGEPPVAVDVAVPVEAEEVDDEEVEDDEDEEEADEEDEYSLLGVPNLLRPEFLYDGTWYAVDQPAKYDSIDWNNSIMQVGSTVNYQCRHCAKVYKRYTIRTHIWFEEQKGKVVCPKCKQPFCTVSYIHHRHLPKCKGQQRKAGRPRKKKN
ncbi:uncharacterized protein LOC130668454 [Microplitis mediator]|uniref:uncharacterized protein LOC130668454 n=1 Tax=Microplitis mediator TaxID=375433 RepID=UPI002553C206|nr:uncharacterized protein LOC130668454 [Microplitis mediator]XP_057326736.1 uncharacterized protein LOC130668454 [Microplitis mediator]XP_057326737.1 uncharacterized protein LOC130668454 [Microplitis mediator]